MNKFFVVINEGGKGTWSDWIWSDARSIAQVYNQNNILNNNILKKLRKIHFSNKLNNKIVVPFKAIWDRWNCIDCSKLDKSDRNYIIFQSNIKFSKRYLKKLKKKKNACIVLYLPDTIEKLGIAKNKKEFKRYCDYYQIDVVFSFDKADCEKYELEFFDLYSSELVRKNKKNYKKRYDLFYIGQCRNETRLKLIKAIYKRLRENLNLNFFLFGVEKEKQKYSENIKYNQYLKYNNIVDIDCESQCILELMNEKQSGNTLRFKEAICFNIKLLTNNKNVLNSKFYNPKYIQYFDKVENINIKWIREDVKVDYGYDAEFSPKKLFEKIIILDKNLK